MATWERVGCRYFFLFPDHVKGINNFRCYTFLLLEFKMTCWCYCQCCCCFLHCDVAVTVAVAVFVDNVLLILPMLLLLFLIALSHIIYSAIFGWAKNVF